MLCDKCKRETNVFISVHDDITVVGNYCPEFECAQYALMLARHIKDKPIFQKISF